MIDLLGCVEREIKEELGIDTKYNEVESIESYVIIANRDSLNICMMYKVKMNISKEEIAKNFKDLNKKLTHNGETPEFCDIKFLKNDKKIIKAFLENNKKPINNALQRILEVLAADEKIEENFIKEFINKR